MILGLSLAVIGNIFIWQAEEQTTQYFSGWVFGVIILSIAGGLPRLPKALLVGISLFFIIKNEQRTTNVTKNLVCVHGEERVIGGEYACVCNPPYIGDQCDTCAPGAIIENLGTGEAPICKTCKHQYIFPHCEHLQPGYETETKCKPNWIPSCASEIDLSFLPKTYGDVQGVRNTLYDLSEEECMGDAVGTIYCDKCKEGHAGLHCCKDGFYGQDCLQKVPTCSFMGDYGAKLKNNVIPTDFNLVDPSICYNLDDDTCSCGGEFIGDFLCASGYCFDGKCSDLPRVPEYNFRCDCDVGVGPDCETPNCYGGTRMYNGTSICRCDAKHTDSFNGTVFDACEVSNDGTCYPGLYGKQCKECQCAVNLTSYTENGDTKQCSKNRYDVFDRDFRTKELRGGCRESGYCTNEPDDCGEKVDGNDRCLLFTNPETFTAILFSGDLCLDTRDSKCAVWEPCQPR